MANADGFIHWMYKKLKLQNRFIGNNLASWKVNRGEIYTCYLGENIGYEKSKQAARPCIVVSSDSINHESGNVVVIPLSKNIKYRDAAKGLLRYNYHYVLKKSVYKKLSYDSAVQCEDIRNVSKVRLCTYIDHVDPSDMIAIKKRIKKALQV